MRRVIQSSRAKRDAREILKYLAERSEPAAAQFAADLADRFDCSPVCRAPAGRAMI